MKQARIVIFLRCCWSGMGCKWSEPEPSRFHRVHDQYHRFVVEYPLCMIFSHYVIGPPSISYSLCIYIYVSTHTHVLKPLVKGFSFLLEDDPIIRFQPKFRPLLHCEYHHDVTAALNIFWAPEPGRATWVANPHVSCHGVPEPSTGHGSRFASRKM